MNDTPRTNDIIDQVKGFRTASALYSLEQFSRLLERELAAVTEQRDRLAEAVNAATILIAAKGRHNTMLAYNGLRDALQSLTPNEP